MSRCPRVWRFLALLALAGLAGCQTTTTSSPASSPANAPNTNGTSNLRVALILPGSKDDQGWNQLAWEGLPLIERELGAHISDQRSTAAQALEGMRAYARDGYDVIFAHGSEFSDAATRAAEEFPEVFFVVNSSDVSGKNLTSIHWDLSDAAYLAGILAAGLSKTGRAGQIGGQDLEPVARAFRAFQYGGQAHKPGFLAQTTYVGNWEDSSLCKEKTLAMLNAGADIIFQNADQAGRGAFLAVEENKDAGALAIGSNRNQNEDNPDIICASAILDVPGAMLEIVNDIHNGDFQPNHVYNHSLSTGTVRLEINPRFLGRIPPETLAHIEAATEAIKAGELDPLSPEPE